MANAYFAEQICEWGGCLKGNYPLNFVKVLNEGSNIAWKWLGKDSRWLENGKWRYAIVEGR